MRLSMFLKNYSEIFCKMDSECSETPTGSEAGLLNSFQKKETLAANKITLLH
jgi:hypothetical protein